MKERIRLWRLDRAKLKLADLEHHARTWGYKSGFSNRPSENRAEKRRIEKQERRVASLEGSEGS